MPAISISPSIDFSMEAIICRDRLQGSLDYNRRMMLRDNKPLYDQVNTAAEMYAEPFLSELGNNGAQLIDSAFCVGGYATYMAFSLQFGGEMPIVSPLSLRWAINESPQPTLRGHEWHFAVHSDKRLKSVLTKILDSGQNPNSLPMQNAVFSGAGLVSYVLGNHVARHN